MAELTVSAAKKAKINTPLSHVTTKEQEKQFKTEFNADGGVGALWSFLPTASTLRTLTLNDHLESKKYGLYSVGSLLLLLVDFGIGTIPAVFNSFGNLPFDNEMLLRRKCVKLRTVLPTLLQPASKWH